MMRIGLIKETGDKIKKRRKALDISQETLAKKVSLSRASIANIERGVQAIDLPQLFLFAEQLDTTPQALLPEFNADPLKKLADIDRALVEGVIREVKYG